MFGAVSGLSLPSFWLGLMLIQLFAVTLGWLPTGGMESWKSYILPAFTLGTGVAAVSRTFYTVILDGCAERRLYPYRTDQKD